jgi:hypothetical protein
MKADGMGLLQSPKRSRSAQDKAEGIIERSGNSP